MLSSFRVIHSYIIINQMNDFTFQERANNKSNYQQSTITTPDPFGRNNDEEYSNENNVSDLNCDSTLSNYALRNTSGMQRMNHNDQNADCVGLQNIELIPPPTYNEATISSSIPASEVTFLNHDSLLSNCLLVPMGFK